MKVPDFKIEKYTEKNTWFCSELILSLKITPTLYLSFSVFHMHLFMLPATRLCAHYAHILNTKIKNYGEIAHCFSGNSICLQI